MQIFLGSSRSNRRSRSNSQSSESSRSPSPFLGMKKTYKKGSAVKPSAKESKLTLKNYLYDNKMFKETELKKCIEITENSDEEVWIFNCPKSVNVTQLVGSKVNFECGGSIRNTDFEVSTENFRDKKSLTLITSKKTPGSEIVTDKVNLFEATGVLRLKKLIKIPKFELDEKFLTSNETMEQDYYKKSKKSPKKLNAMPR